MSLLVPGFGLVRAGRVKRGIAWWCGLYIFTPAVALATACAAIPLWAIVLLIAVGLLLTLGMIWDSCRPGRLNWKGWSAFLLLLIASFLAPYPADLIAKAYLMPVKSMEPTIMGRDNDGNGGDRVIVSKIAYIASPIRRGDVIAFRANDIPLLRLRLDPASDIEVVYVKRVVGLPGEQLRFADGRIFTDDRLLDAKDGLPPVNYVNPVNLEKSELKFTVPEGGYFLVGDNARYSYDSRNWGAVPAASVIGKVVRIYYPFGRAGAVEFPAPATPASP